MVVYLAATIQGALTTQAICAHRKALFGAKVFLCGLIACKLSLLSRPTADWCTGRNGFRGRKGGYGKEQSSLVGL